jgi:hypothetical protein
MVGRVPKRMVPPLCVVLPSGMNTTAGLGHAGSNSAELASAIPNTLRENSITAA